MANAGLLSGNPAMANAGLLSGDPAMANHHLFNDDPRRPAAAPMVNIPDDPDHLDQFMIEGPDDYEHGMDVFDIVSTQRSWHNVIIIEVCYTISLLLLVLLLLLSSVLLLLLLLHALRCCN